MKTREESLATILKIHKTSVYVHSWLTYKNKNDFTKRRPKEVWYKELRFYLKVDINYLVIYFSGSDILFDYEYGLNELNAKDKIKILSFFYLDEKDKTFEEEVFEYYNS